MSNNLPKLGSDFEIWGHWWLPEFESDKVPGCLSCDRGNIELKLLGQFDSINVNRLHAKVPLIHGVGDTKLFSLWNGIQDQFGFRSPGTLEQRFHGMRVLVGRLLPDRTEVQFTGVGLSAANLGPWSGLRPVTYSFSLENPADMTYRLAEGRFREILLPSQSALMRVGSSISTVNDEFQRYGFDVIPSAHVEFKTRKTFEECIAFVGSLQRIISLLSGRELIAESASVDIEGGRGSDNVLDLLLEHAPPVDEKPLNTHEVLVPLTALEAGAPEILDLFFREESRIRDSVDLFLGTIRRRQLPLPTELTTLAQSLETFHRNVHGGNYMSPDAYAPLAAELSAQIPSEVEKSHRDALKNRIKYGYQYSFRKRLEKLVRSFEATLLASLGIDPDTFPELVANARNDFTHWDSQIDAARLRGADLNNIVVRLKAFTRLVLLSHLGVDPQLVVSRMVSNQHIYLPLAVPIEWANNS